MDDTLTPKASGQPFQFHHGDALLRNVIENAAVATFLVKPSGDLLYANRAFRELLGYSSDEIAGLGADKVVHPEDAAQVREQTADIVESRTESYRGEQRYVRKDGTTVWVLASAAPVINERTGRPLHLTVQAIDIGPQKRAEAALAKIESRWNYALEAAEQGVWDSDVASGMVYYSRTWRTMRGFGPEEEVDSAKEEWLKRVHPEDRERIRHIVTKQNIGEIRRNAMEYREQHRNGHYIWILSRGGPIAWDANGTPTRFVGTDTDITSLKAVEAALALEKEKLRVTLQSIGDGVISTDADARVTFMNPIAEQMTGWDSSEAIGRRVEEVFAVVDENTGEPVVDPVRQAIASQELQYLNENAVLISRTGERRAVRDSAAPVRTPEGELLGAVLVFQDITHARALQKELAHSAKHDGLTGLANRTAFETALTSASDQARSELREHALCFIDLDRFKAVNDTAGHAAGDALLQQIAHAIRRACRSQEFTARIGGDEFALLLADCSIAGAQKAAQQVIDSIAGVHFTWHGRTYDIGASVGITAVRSKSPRLVELISQADAACYAAKKAGRNRVGVYDAARHGPQPVAQIA